MALTLTKKVKSYLIENCGVAADAKDTKFKSVLGSAIATGKGGMSYDKYVELSSGEDESPSKVNDDEDLSVKDLLKLMIANQKQTAPRSGSSHEFGEGVDSSMLEEPEVKEPAKKQSKFMQIMSGKSRSETTGALLSVGDAKSRYGTTKAPLKFKETTSTGSKHPFAGMPAFEGGRKGTRTLTESSELEKAVTGAWSKWVIQQELGAKCPRVMRCSDHELDLVQYALAECKWAGVIGGKCSGDEGAHKVKNRHLKGSEVKSILDDAISGAIEITPIFFDDAIIMTPILYGEFAPRINMVPITRGRRIEGGSMGNVTLGPSTEGVPIPLFNTAGFIAAFDTTIFVVAGSIEIGLDEMSDSPIDTGGIITGQYGRVLLEWLDRVICAGNGTNEPEGIINAAGTVNVNFGGVAATVGNYESLLFGIAKRYKQGFDKSRICFGANEQTYQRSRGIAVGTGDNRRVFGLNEENYMLFDHNYGINESLANTQGFFANLGRYRMYRRQGLTFRASTEGKELIRDNEMLLSCRARFGGQIEDGNAFAVSQDMEA